MPDRQPQSKRVLERASETKKRVVARASETLTSARASETLTTAETRPGPDKPHNTSEHQSLKGSEAEAQPKKWDIIDENAWESFPASDAPASWAGRDLTPEERAARKAMQEKEREQSS